MSSNDRICYKRVESRWILDSGSNRTRHLYCGEYLHPTSASLTDKTINRSPDTRNIGSLIYGLGPMSAHIAGNTSYLDHCRAHVHTHTHTPRGRLESAWTCMLHTRGEHAKKKGLFVVIKKSMIEESCFEKEPTSSLPEDGWKLPSMTLILLVLSTLLY